MRYFWPIYLSVAVAGTAGIYLCAPKLGLAHRKAAPAAEARGAATVPNGTTRTAPSTAARKQVEEETLPDLPPALAGIYLAHGKERPTWGVTSQETTAYSAKGVNRGTIPAGTIFRTFSALNTSRGEMLLCLAWPDASSPLLAVSSLVSRASSVLFTGDPGKLTQKQCADLIAYYALAGSIAKRKTELLQKAAQGNPFYAASTTAYRKYMAHIEESRVLVQKRDRTTGELRNRLDSQLYERKMSESVLAKEYNEIHAKFKDWKAKHPESAIDPEKDPQIQSWRSKMTEMIHLIPGLAT